MLLKGSLSASLLIKILIKSPSLPTLYNPALFNGYYFTSPPW